MLAFRSVVSVLVSFVRSFSTNSRPALRAASGRPPAANDTTLTGGNRPHPVAQSPTVASRANRSRTPPRRRCPYPGQCPLLH